jgi:hypothetical protein
MLELLRGKVSDRKLRLFAVACCRQFHTSDEGFVQAIGIAEKYADGSGSKAGLRRARQAVKKVRHAQIDSGKEDWASYWLAEVTASESAFRMVAAEIERLIGEGLVTPHRRILAPAAVRCIFGPLPFRPVALDSAWRTSNVTALAQAIYDDRAFDRLPILADALEDGGCDNADILNHCRQPGEHVRGCWVVDLVLGKE